jgi:hypothetical protein
MYVYIINAARPIIEREMKRHSSDILDVKEQLYSLVRGIKITLYARFV